MCTSRRLVITKVVHVDELTCRHLRRDALQTDVIQPPGRNSPVLLARGFKREGFDGQQMPCLHKYGALVKTSYEFPTHFTHACIHSLLAKPSKPQKIEDSRKKISQTKAFCSMRTWRSRIYPVSRLLRETLRPYAYVRRVVLNRAVFWRRCSSEIAR